MPTLSNNERFVLVWQYLCQWLWFSLILPWQHKLMKLTSCPGHFFFSFSWTQLAFPTSWIHKTWGLTLSLVLLSLLLQQQVLHVCFREHNGLMAGWQSHFIMCALNTRDSTMWNTNPPHPCTKAEWIILMRHQLTALSRCNKRHILAPYAAVGFSPWPVIVAQTISRVAVKVCRHIVVASIQLAIVWPYQGNGLLRTHV